MSHIIWKNTGKISELFTTIKKLEYSFVTFLSYNLFITAKNDKHFDYDFQVQQRAAYSCLF
jgi:hypothetical protein